MDSISLYRIHILMVLDSESFRVHLKLILKANLGLLKPTLSEIVKKACTSPVECKCHISHVSDKH